MRATLYYEGLLTVEAGEVMKQNGPQRATREDVAKRAGVSVTVVSYVLNNNRYVSEEKRKRVLQAAKELNYIPSNIARALKGKNSQHIIFIVDNTANERFGRLMTEMDQYAYERNAMISLCKNRSDEAFIRQIIARQFDGIIISSISFPEEHIKQLVDAGNNVVLLLNREYKDIAGVVKIDTGLYRGERECVRYLYQQNRRSMIYVDRISKRDHFSDLRDNRYRGYVHEMEACGLSDKQYILTGCTNEEELQQRLIAYMDTHPVDAVLARNDQIACIVINAILKSGRRIPEDVAVIGFDNTTICQLMTPTLTSMKMEDKEVARAAIETVYKMKEGSFDMSPLSFSAKMIVRQSTKTGTEKDDFESEALSVNI